MRKTQKTSAKYRFQEHNRERMKIASQRKRCQSLPPLTPGETERLVAEFKARRNSPSS